MQQRIYSRLPDPVACLRRTLPALILLALGATVGCSSSESPVIEETGPVATEDAIETIPELLVMAEKAFQRGDILEPPSENAVYFFRLVLSEQPNNSVARDGLDRLVLKTLAGVEEALADGRLDEASAAIATARLIQPRHPDLVAARDALKNARQAIMIAEAREANAAGNRSRARALLEEAESMDGGDPEKLAAARHDIARAEASRRLQANLVTSEQRLADNQLFEPQDDSAEHYLVAALRINPDNEAALALQARLLETVASQALVALQADDMTTVTVLMAHAERVLPGSPAMQPVQTALAEIEIAQATRELASTHNIIATAVASRLAAGKLLEPADDSALHFISSLAEADAAHPRLAVLRGEFAEALLTAAADAVAEDDFETAMALANQAGDQGADESALAEIGGLIADRQAANTAQVTPATTRPATANKAGSSPETDLKRLVHVPPEYPQRAIDMELEGWVEVEYTVNAEGKTEDIIVVNADPKRMFDKAATRAVRRWSYDPATVGVAARRTRTRIVFGLE